MHIKNTLRFSALSLTILSLIPATSAFAGSNMLIIPAADHTLPTSISSGQTVSAFYTVINNTHSTRSGYKVQGLPNSVKQNTSGTMSCTNPITLVASGSCTLQLDITSAVHSNFAICKGTNCTTAEVPLNVSQNATPSIPRITVGSYTNKYGENLPLIYTSSDAGSSWTLNTTLKYPANAYIGRMLTHSRIGSTNIQLYGVSCDHATKLQCTAVGGYLTDAQITVPLAYTSSDAGKSWTVSTPILLPNDAENAALSSVSCNNTNLKCVAVGTYDSNVSVGDTLPLTYTSTNGGKSWIVGAGNLALPIDVAPAGDRSVALTDVSCNGTGQNCTAVGSYKNADSNDAPLAYTSTNGGQSWTLRTIPMPSDPSTIKPSTLLRKVACDDATGTFCTAVGGYNSTSELNKPLAYTTSNGGANWSQTQVPLPSNLNELGLNAVSCDEAGIKCQAAGGATTRQTLLPSTTLPPVVYTSSNGGHAWSTSNPILTAPNTSYVLNGIICDNNSGMLCSAVGSVTERAAFAILSSYPTVFKSSDGGMSWSPVSISLPSDIGTPSIALRKQQLNRRVAGLTSVQ